MDVKGKCPDCGGVFSVSTPDPVAELVPADSKDAADRWMDDCMRATQAFANLLCLTQRCNRTTAVAELARTFQDPCEPPAVSLFTHCWHALRETGVRYASPIPLDGLDYLLNLPPARQELIRASIRGVLLGWNLARE